MKVYISGPISGLKREDYMMRFAIAERMLRQAGHKVCNPTTFWVCRWPWLYKIVGYWLTLAYDIYQLKRCDAILTLPGWAMSFGAQMEKTAAVGFGIRQMCDVDFQLYCDIIHAVADAAGLDKDAGVPWMEKCDKV